MISPQLHNYAVVIPAQAGTQGRLHRRALPWIPAFAGMTAVGVGQ